MNIFIIQNIGWGIAFKILISETVESRFRQNLAEILESGQVRQDCFILSV